MLLFMEENLDPARLLSSPLYAEGRGTTATLKGVPRVRPSHHVLNGADSPAESGAGHLSQCPAAGGSGVSIGSQVVIQEGSKGNRAVTRVNWEAKSGIRTAFH